MAEVKFGTQGRPVGGTVIDSVRIRAKQPYDIRQNFNIPDIPIKEHDTSKKPIYRCTCCGTSFVRQTGNFTKTKSPLYKANNGYNTICKSCVEKYYQGLVDKFSGNEEHALKHMCALLDWYYCDTASSYTLSQLGSFSRVTMYPGKMSTVQVKCRGQTYLDTVKDDVSLDFSDLISAVEEQAAENAKYDPDKIIKDWPPGLSEQEYIFLVNQYEDWVSKTEIETKAQEELIRTICLAQLNIRRAQSGTGGKVENAMKAFTELLSSCNLTPKQKSDAAPPTTEQLAYGEFIKKIEETEPIGEPDDKFKDPDRIRTYIKTFFTGHLAKALHIKTGDEEEYEDVMKKYTVDVEESSNDETVVSVFDQYTSQEGAGDGEGTS